VCLARMSGEWQDISPGIHLVQEGAVGETLALQVGPVRETIALQAQPVGETVAKHDILL
jgi:hypothetical protein